MDKKEILHRLKTSREINEGTRTKNWKDAFEAYRQAKGVSLSFNCTKCYNEVKEWLNED